MANKIILLFLLSISPSVWATSATTFAREIVERSKELEDLKAGQEFIESLTPPPTPLEREVPLERKAPPQQESAPSLKRGKSCKDQPKCQSQRYHFSKPQKNAQVSQVILFVSFALSDESLKAYARDLEIIGGRLVLRGLLNNSFAQTQKKLSALQIAIDIDPPLFETYGITHVPTFIHLAPSSSSETPPYDSVQGHISLSHALEIFKEKGVVLGAEAHLSRLRKARGQQ